MIARLVPALVALLRVIGLVVALGLAGAAGAADSARELTERYSAIRAQLVDSPRAVPIVITSHDANGLMRGEIGALLPGAFDSVTPRLTTPRDWCEIALLHLNTKACTHERNDAGLWLTVYSGRKTFEPAEQAYPLRYRFVASTADPAYLRVQLNAEEGPLGTREHQMTLEAMPADAGATFVRFRFSYRPSMASRLATNAYLATAGEGKRGLTEVGRTADGAIEYVGGTRGVVERNAVRNYFAIQAYLESHRAPSRDQVRLRLERWFELTEQFPQLHELDRQDYLRNKQNEYRQQLAHQQAIDAKSVSAVASSSTPR